VINIEVIVNIEVGDYAAVVATRTDAPHGGATADGPKLTRGHKKKERTRRLLLDTAQAVVADRGEAFSISDITARAGVSNGTFYNYFADRDALLAELVDDVVTRFTDERAASTEIDDPAERFATITADALATVAAEPDLARVSLRLDQVRSALLDGGPFGHLRQDLAAGQTEGRFAAGPDDATIDVVVGGILTATRRIADGDADRGYRVAVVRRLLVALGVDGAEAVALAERAVGDG
jgi:AcrR family transcriptional regulator